MKKCKKGHEYEFISGNKIGCPECRKIDCAKYTNNNRELVRKANRKYSNKNKEKIKERQKAYRIANPDIIRGRSLRKRYWPDLTNEQALIEYDKLFTEQKGCCKLCARHQALFKQRLAVDHDHKTLKVRGLLCNVCNRRVISMIDFLLKLKTLTITKDDLLRNIIMYYAA